MAAPTEKKTKEAGEQEFSNTELGTKQHWDATYGDELRTFKDIGDIGYVWYGEEGVRRIVRWMNRCPLVTEDSTILDLGCGNGAILLDLHEKGYKHLTGVDYSEAAVKLAQSAAEEKQANITYQQGDLLAELTTCSGCLSSRHDVCIDKGTYDVLNYITANSERQRDLYICNVRQLLIEGGLLIIMSCNWTEEQLVESFTKHGFALHCQIPTATFQFGGKVGNKETCLVFKATDENKKTIEQHCV